MKHILWVSRHQMTTTQLADLERIMGDTVELEIWPDTVQAVEELLPLLDRADAAAVVLPVELLAQLWKLADGKPILQAVSERVPTGRVRQLDNGSCEPEFSFVHKGWQQILRIEVETQML